MELREIEEESQEQNYDAIDIGIEAEIHHQKMRELERAVGLLKEAQAAMDSEGMRLTLEEAEKARKVTEERMQELREQSEALMERNQEITAQLVESIARKRNALDQLQHMRGIPNGPGGMKIYEQMEKTINDDLERSNVAGRGLRNVRDHLNGLDLSLEPAVSS